MKFSQASIPLAILASTVAAQGGGYGPQNQQYGPPSNQGGYQQGGYQQGGYQQGGYQQGGYGQPPQQQHIGGANPGQYPNIPDYEVADWYECTKKWLEAINAGSSGSTPACAVYNCLEAQAGKYNRGGTMAQLGRLITPVCWVGSGVAGLVSYFVDKFFTLRENH